MSGSYRRILSLAATGTLLAGVLAAGTSVITPFGAGADTDPTTLVGQGGSFLEPVMEKLVTDDAANLNPLLASYLLTDDNSGLAAFVGTGVGQFSADYAVTQRPLTSAESDQAKADGRSYAYIPFAATPVAIATLVPTFVWEQSGATSISSTGFCQSMPLTVQLLGDIFGYNSALPLSHWNDSRLTCPSANSTSTVADALPIAAWANLDPSMANYSAMNLLDSTMGSKADFDAALAGVGSLTTSDTPSESWPFAGDTVPGGDQPLIGKLLAINSETNAPSTQAGTWQLGAIAPLSSVWTGAPLGVSWNLPTAAIQNANLQFVAPSTTAAQAAEADATLATSKDPTTNNLVTFNANPTDAAAYNSLLMEESYLVVPTNGLSATKAAGLAKLVRFVLGPKGQQDIESFGSAPATSAMQTAGLEVATELSAEASASPVSANSTPAGTSSTTSNSASSPSSSSSGNAGSGSNASANSGNSGASNNSGLAFTGSAHLGAIIGTGLSLLLLGAGFRRWLGKREVRS